MPECTVEQPTQYARSLRPSTPSARTTAATLSAEITSAKILGPDVKPRDRLFGVTHVTEGVQETIKAGESEDPARK
jgi:hypothetical protein